MSKHIKLPLSVEDLGEEYVPIHDATGATIAEVRCYDSDTCCTEQDRESLVNAANEIAHACNCHDELLAACKRAYEILIAESPLDYCQFLVSTIAKAEGMT